MLHLARLYAVLFFYIAKGMNMKLFFIAISLTAHSAHEYESRCDLKLVELFSNRPRK